MRLPRLEAIRNALLENLRRPRGYVALAHDFFLDILLQCGDLEEFMGWLRDVSGRGGGNVVIKVAEVTRGGCAANTASALASLGVPVVLYGKTSGLGMQILKRFFTGLPVDLQFSTGGELGFTVSLEGAVGGRRVNIMLTHLGANADFAFRDISEEGLRRLGEARALMLTSYWGNARRLEFAQQTLQYAKESGVEYTVIDTGDPVPHHADVDELVRLLNSGCVDRISLNENEARHYASHIARRPMENLVECCRLIHEETGVDVDLHHAEYALTITSGRETAIPTYRVEVRRLTGAGDAWNAGNILGLLLGLNDGERLLLANAVAGFYISNPTPKHPNMEEVREFVKKSELRA